MGMKTKEIGGGPATGLADNYVGMLQQLLNGGGMGTAGSPDGPGSTGNIMSVLADILSGGGGKAGSSISQMMSKQQERDVNNLRSRFGAQGGTAFGTPAAFAEATYRADAAPNIMQAISGMQMQAIMPLLSAATGLSQLGIPQRQTVQQKSGLGQALDVFGGLAKTAMPFVMPGFGAAAGGAMGGAGGGAGGFGVDFSPGAGFSGGSYG